MENNKMMPVVGAVILAGIIIAGAIIYTNKTPSDEQTAGLNQPEDNENYSLLDSLKPISSDDHALGNPDAELTLVLYSDIECSYCKSFHITMNQLMDTYGKDGKLKWIFRHFPLEQIHPTAKKEAEATECVNELGGNEKFWEYLSELSNNFVPNPAILNNQLADVASEIGIDENSFKQCLESGKYTSQIADSIQEAVNVGGTGTPYSVIIDKQDNATPVEGALTYEQMKQIIDSLLGS